MTQSSMIIHIATPDSEVCKSAVESVMLPGYAGMMEVMSGHEKMVVILKKGGQIEAKLADVRKNEDASKPEAYGETYVSSRKKVEVYELEEGGIAYVEGVGCRVVAGKCRRVER